MSELRDDELRDALWDASGDECDTGTALGQVEARVRRIRRRRMDIAGVGLLVALVVTLVVASRTRADDSPNRPASVVTAAPPVTSALSTTSPSTAAPADTNAVPSTDVVAARAPAPADSTAPVTDDTTPPDESAAEMAPADDPGSTAPAPEPTSAASHPAAPPAGAHANRTEQTFIGAGGRLTVAATDGGLRFVSASARYGYVAGQPVVGTTSVEIDFRSRTARSRIHVDLVDGRLVPTISNDDGSGRRPGRTSSTTAASSATTNAGSAGGDGGGAATGGSGTTGGSSDGPTGSSGTGGSTGPGTTATTAGSHWGDRSGRG